MGTEMTRRKPDSKSLLRLPNGEPVSIGAVARGTGLHPTTVSRIFGGKRRPSVDAAASIAGYLGISIEKLRSNLNYARRSQ